MKFRFYIISLIIMSFMACEVHNPDDHGDEHEHEHDQEENLNNGDHNHEDTKFQITAYSDSFEVFAESDPFIKGEKSYILAHFTYLNDFSALDNAQVVISLKMKDKTFSDTQDKSVRPGIYRFMLTPAMAGIAQLHFEVKSNDMVYQIDAGDYQVFNESHEAIHWAEDQEISGANSVVFTKEQSWKVDFKTELPEIKYFGNIIKATAIAEPCHEGEINISAKSNGIIQLQSKHYAQGMQVKKGEEMFVISGNELAENNSSVRYLEAKNNFEKAETDLKRVQNLYKDQLVSQQVLTEAQTIYNNAKVIYENININFNKRGQIVKSPIDGYINWMDFENGNYVETGASLLSINNGKRLVLRADVQAKYMKELPYIKDVKIKVLETGEIIELGSINGELLSFGKTTNKNNYLVPVIYEIDNVDEIISGNFVELYLQCAGDQEALVVPSSSILEEQGNHFVFVQLTPELFEKQEVKIGATNGQQTEILSGLKATNRIVSVGGMLIKLAKVTGGLDAHSGHVH